MKKRYFGWFILCVMVTTAVISGCSHKPKTDGLSDPRRMYEKTTHTSKWKRFTIRHPTGFWQVIKNEKWTLLYNNQDAPVQMIVDARVHYFLQPTPQKLFKSFFRSLKMKDPTILQQEVVDLPFGQALKTIFTGSIVYNFWDSFRVQRKIQAYTFITNRRSYVLAYIADMDNFDDYLESFELLQKNITLLDPSSKTNTQSQSQ